ncbi:hypothetical protein BKA80DRAFT_24154 [Phyllosticta citrichinensis]
MGTVPTAAAPVWHMGRPHIRIGCHSRFFILWKGLQRNFAVYLVLHSFLQRKFAAYPFLRHLLVYFLDSTLNQFGEQEVDQSITPSIFQVYAPADSTNFPPPVGGPRDAAITRGDICSRHCGDHLVTRSELFYHVFFDVVQQLSLDLGCDR